MKTLLLLGMFVFLFIISGLIEEMRNTIIKIDMNIEEIHQYIEINEQVKNQIQLNQIKLN